MRNDMSKIGERGVGAADSVLGTLRGGDIFVSSERAAYMAAGVAQRNTGSAQPALLAACVGQRVLAIHHGLSFLYRQLKIGGKGRLLLKARKLLIGSPGQIVGAGKSGIARERTVATHVEPVEIFPEHTLRDVIENGLQHLLRAIQLFGELSLSGQSLVEYRSGNREPEHKEGDDHDSCRTQR